MAFTPEKAQKFLSDAFAGWIQDLNLTVTEIDIDVAVLTMPITPHLTRMGGIICGQSLASMADTAMVMATAAHYGEPRPVATTTLDTHFLRPGVGDTVQCTARIVRAGRSLLLAQAKMIALPSSKEIATATATFFLAD